MKPSRILFFTLLISLLTLGYQVTPGRAQDSDLPSEKSVVQAVIFWMEGCSNCDTVLKEVLPPLEAKYGEQLAITRVQLVTTEDVDQLYQAGAGLGIP